MILTSQAISYVIAFAWLGWTLQLAWAFRRALQSRAVCAALADVTPIHSALMKAVAGDAPASSVESHFSLLCTERGLEPTHPVVSHVRTIVRAGIGQRRLDVAELLGSTRQQLLGRDHGLRTELSLFIILGLLGTLFGLSRSVAAMAPHVSVTVGATSQSQIAAAMTELLTGLGDAFLPSITAIACTVAGVLVFTIYKRLGSDALVTALDLQTISNWVPLLVPTVTEQMLTAVATAERQMTENLRVARDVATLVERSQEDLKEWAPNLNRANLTLKAMTQGAETLAASVSTVREALGVIADTRAEAQEVLEALRRTGRSITEGTDRTLTLVREQNETTRELLEGQNRTVADLYSSVSAFDHEYRREVAQTTTELKGLGDRADVVFQALETKNRELLGSMDQRVQTIDTELSSIHRDLMSGLGALVDRLGRLEAPAQSAARILEGSLDNSNRRIEQCVKELQQEFERRNRLTEGAAAAGAELVARELSKLRTSLERTGPAPPGKIARLMRTVWRS